MGKSSPTMGFSIAIFNSRRVTVAFFLVRLDCQRVTSQIFWLAIFPIGGNKWEQNLVVAYTPVSFGSVQNFGAHWSRCQQYIILWCMIVANRPIACHFFHVTSLLLVLFYPCLSTFDCSAPKVDGRTYTYSSFVFCKGILVTIPFGNHCNCDLPLVFCHSTHSILVKCFVSRLMAQLMPNPHPAGTKNIKKPPFSSILPLKSWFLALKSWLLLVFVMFFDRFNRPISTTFWPHVRDVSATDSSPRLGLNTPNLAELGDRWAGRGS